MGIVCIRSPDRLAGGLTCMARTELSDSIDGCG
jgi:hypothetical protein